MFAVVRQFHTEMFFLLHSLVGESPVLDQVIFFFAKTSDIYIAGLAMLFILIHQHKRHAKSPVNKKQSIIREMFLMTSAILIAWLASYILKQLIGGPRPFEMYSMIEPLFTYAGGDSFPSGHATLFSALAVMLAALHRNIGFFFILLAVLISFARVIAGIHFPIDIVAGWFIGGGISYYVYELLKTKSLH